MDAVHLLTARFAKDHPSQAAAVLEHMSDRESAAFLSEQDSPIAGALLENMAPLAAAAALIALDDAPMEAVLAHLRVDLAAALLRRAGADVSDRALHLMPASRADVIRRHLKYDEETVGGLTDPHALVFPVDATIKEVQRHLRSSTQPVVYLQERGDSRVVGVADAHDIWEARPDQLVDSVMDQEVVALRSTTFLSRAIEHPGWQAYELLPVLDNDDRFVGAISHQALRRWAQLHDTKNAPTSPLELVARLGEFYAVSLAVVVASIPKTLPPTSAQ